MNDYTIGDDVLNETMEMEYFEELLPPPAKYRRKERLTLLERTMR